MKLSLLVLGVLLCVALVLAGPKGQGGGRDETGTKKDGLVKPDGTDAAGTKKEGLGKPDGTDAAGIKKEGLGKPNGTPPTDASSGERLGTHPTRPTPDGPDNAGQRTDGDKEPRRRGN